MTLNLDTALAVNREIDFGKPLTPPGGEFSWLGRFVKWYNGKYSQNNSIHVTILHVTGIVLCIISIGGILFLYKCSQESERQACALRNTDTFQEIVTKREQIVKAIGLERFKKLPVLDLSHRGDNLRCLDFLTPIDMKASLMKGTDNLGRPFLAIKVFDKVNNRCFVQTIFQRRSDYPYWTWGADFQSFKTKEWGIFEKDTHFGIDTEKLQRLTQVFNGHHPHFVLMP